MESTHGAGELEPRTAGRRTGSRIDPLGVLRKVEVFKGGSGWSPDQKEAGTRAKKVRPSEINHGNIAPTVQPLGVTCAYAEHRAVITLAGLRRLRFGSDERDRGGTGPARRPRPRRIGGAGRRRLRLAVALRSRLRRSLHRWSSYEQTARPKPSISIVTRRGHCTRKRTPAPSRRGFRFESIVLTPQDKLVEIVRRSRELALEGAGGEESDDS